MSQVTTAVLFLLGVYLAMRVIAALYRILDLWYAIGREYAFVIRGLAGWGSAAVIVALLAQGHLRAAFLWGMGGYVAFYLSLYAVRNIAIRRDRVS